MKPNVLSRRFKNGMNKNTTLVKRCWKHFDLSIVFGVSSQPALDWSTPAEAGRNEVSKGGTMPRARNHWGEPKKRNGTVR